MNATNETVALHNAGRRSEEASIFLPEKSFTERRVAALVFLLSFFYLYLFRRYTIMEPDEGILLQGAQRILRGEVLYRDCFSFFTPGSYYFLALLFRIFGSSFTVARTALVFFGGIYSVIAYLLARRVCSRGIALTVTGLMALTTLPFRFLVLHNWDSTMLACLAVYAAVRLLESPQWKWAFATGSLVSLTFLFEQSKGAGLGIGLGIGLLTIVLSNRQQYPNKMHPAGLILGMAWPLMITFTYFAAQHSLAPMLSGWLWPLHHYSLANHVPYGYQNWSDRTRYELFGNGSIDVRLVTVLTLSPCFLIPTLPLIVVGLWFYWIVQTWRQRASQAKCAYYVVMSAALSGLLLSVVIVRADIIHFIYLQPLFCVALAWIMDGRDMPGKLLKALRPAVNIYVVVVFLLFSVPLLLRTVGAPNKIVTRRGTVTAPAKDTVVEYLQSRVAPGETILVYPYLPLYYYLTATFSPSRFEYFQPGMNTAQQSQELLSELAARRVRVVLYESSFPEKIPNSWPGTPMSAIANDPVADYIQRKYHYCAMLRSPSDWTFLFMMRKDVPCP